MRQPQRRRERGQTAVLALRGRKAAGTRSCWQGRPRGPCPCLPQGCTRVDREAAGSNSARSTCNPHSQLPVSGQGRRCFQTPARRNNTLPNSLPVQQTQASALHMPASLGPWRRGAVPACKRLGISCQAVSLQQPCFQDGGPQGRLPSGAATALRWHLCSTNHWYQLWPKAALYTRTHVCPRSYHCGSHSQRQPQRQPQQQCLRWLVELLGLCHGRAA
mmetsp:Transcript_98424/g.190093  ORF Transcript_98424/g.190093 Transcript_98424/m.190093 type:complete len:218 (-) Transcript_98424:267-920(-)